MKLSATLAAVALLAIASACSGQHATPVTVNNVTSKSPALIKAAPMARTRILPASAMLSRTPASNANTLVFAGWTQLSGRASAISPSGSATVLALSDQPGGPDKAIWTLANGTWTNISGLASELAQTPDGTIYAVNSGGGIFAYSGGSWTGLGGGASSIAAASDNSIYAISNGGSGDRGIWHYSGGTWTQVPGSGIAVYSALDIQSERGAGGTLSPGGIYVGNSGGAVYYLNPDGSYVQIPGSASSLAALSSDLYTGAGQFRGIFALAYPAVDGGSSIYFYNYGYVDDAWDNHPQCWSQIPGAAVSLAVDGTNLDAVGGGGGIYRSDISVLPPSPGPTPTPPFTPPSPC